MTNLLYFNSYNSFSLVLKSIIIGLLAASFFFINNAIAAPPASPYAPNETLSPNCAPGDTNCIVNEALFGPWISNSTSIFTTSSNVGINTSSPDKALEVGGDLEVTNTLFTDSSNEAVGIATDNPTTEVPFTQLRVSGGGDVVVDNGWGYFTANDSGTGLGPGVEGAGSLQKDLNLVAGVVSGVRRKMRFTKEGNLGINDPNPDAHLEVSSDSTTGNNAFIVSSNSSTDGDLLTLLEDGNLGIGESSPFYKLDLKGNIRLQDDDNWIGAGSTIERIEFDRSLDRIDLEDANITIDDNKWLGINGSNPRITFEDSSDNFDFKDGDLRLENNRWIGIGTTSEKIVFDSNDDQINLTGGDVGVGTATPETALEVSGTTTISDVMQLEPRSSAPSGSLGKIYVDSDSNELCFYNGSSWTGLESAGACN